MRKTIKWAIGALAIILLVGLPFCFVPYMSSNLATLISGIWSALATAILGFIALWQNRRYQEYADQYNDLQYMPEFYEASISEVLTEVDRLKPLPRAKVETTEVCSVLPLTIMAYKPPILGLNIIELTIDGRLVGKQPVEKAVDIHPCKPALTLAICVPKSTVDDNREHKANAVFQYKNLHGTLYSKTILFCYKGTHILDITFNKAKKYEN